MIYLVQQLLTESCERPNLLLHQNGFAAPKRHRLGEIRSALVLRLGTPHHVSPLFSVAVTIAEAIDAAVGKKNVSVASFASFRMFQNSSLLSLARDFP